MDGLEARKILEPCPGDGPVSKEVETIDSELKEARRVTVDDLGVMVYIRGEDDKGKKGVIVAFEEEVSMGRLRF